MKRISLTQRKRAVNALTHPPEDSKEKDIFFVLVFQTSETLLLHPRPATALRIWALGVLALLKYLDLTHVSIYI